MSSAVAFSDHQPPALPRPEQDAAATAKPAEFEKRTGKKPNIVILLLDDMGYGDPDAFGGGRVLLHGSVGARGFPFPGQTHPTVSVMGVPSVVTPLRTATAILRNELWALCAAGVWTSARRAAGLA